MEEVAFLYAGRTEGFLEEEISIFISKQVQEL
jgi:hypothetical protein